MIDTDDIMLNIIRTLKTEVEHYKKMTKDAGTGHIFTTISFLEGRIKELTDELTNAKPNSFNKTPWVDWHDGNIIG